MPIQDKKIWRVLLKVKNNLKETDEKESIMTHSDLTEEIYHYRKLVKEQRKVLESLSQKVLNQEKIKETISISEKRFLNLKEQLEYYKAKSKILEKQFGKKINLSKQIFEEIQRNRTDITINKYIFFLKIKK